MKWLEVADKIQESGQRPRIHHVSQFVCAKPRAANNPVFGDDFNDERERTKKDGFKPKTKPPSTKGTTLATPGDSRKPGQQLCKVKEHNQTAEFLRDFSRALCLEDA